MKQIIITLCVTKHEHLFFKLILTHSDAMKQTYLQKTQRNCCKNYTKSQTEWQTQLITIKLFNAANRKTNQ